MEFDKRFDVYGQNFIQYDYNYPLQFDKNRFCKYFDVLVVDPPFLSEECFQKVWQTVAAVMKPDGAKIIWCTGRIMREHLDAVGLRECKFEPMHRGGLANDFGCFLNYESSNSEKFGYI